MDISLDEAIEEIRLTVDQQQDTRQDTQQTRKEAHRGSSPFFFIVGAGISHPPVPLAEDIVQDCKQRRPVKSEPPFKSALERYSYWLERAYPSPNDRRKYFDQMIRGKPISEANLRLAHLLGGRLAKVVVTPNFDDFLSRALHLFGQHHLVCDHPHTVARVNFEEDEIQILHVHGTYKFYDLANLKGDIGSRARSNRGLSMSGLLAQLFRQHSPLVVGYSGWEDDVIMTALKKRLKSELPYNLYWFCYRREDRDKLPEWLKRHGDVRFVLPERAPAGAKNLNADFENVGAMAINQFPVAEPNLPARRVFEKFIEAFDVKPPELLDDPLKHLARRLEASFLEADSPPSPDLYSLRSVVERVRRANALLLQVKLQEFERQMEALRDAVRRARHHEVVGIASRLQAKDLQNHPKQAREFMSLLRAAASALDKPEERLRAWNKLIEVAGSLLKHGQRDSAMEGDLAWALYMKGVTLEHLGRSEEAIAVYDEVVRRFGEAPKYELRAEVAAALVSKAYMLQQLERFDEAAAIYDDVVQRLGEDSNPVRRKIARFVTRYAAAALALTAKRMWREGQEPKARQLLSGARARLRFASSYDRAKRLALAGYIAFLLSEEAEAKAHISKALRLNAEEAGDYLLDLARYQPLPRDKKLKSWLKTLEGR
jgi:tetratricopeptide (TPR) repeat protein